MSKQLMAATPGNMRQIVSNNAMQKQIQSMIGDPKKRDQMASSMVSMVQQTPTLQECEIQTVFNSAIAGAALDLPYGFGFWYAVPYNNKKKGYKEAQFQLGFKGYLQLAIRSGEYKNINAVEIKDGELIEINPFTQEVKLKPMGDYKLRKSSPTVGYYAFFELHNGFKKEMYWSYEEMMAHADEYSSAFKENIYLKIQNGKIDKKDLWKYSSFWYKNFDEMAKKTMLRQLISKWGIMSIDMQRAYSLDHGVVKVDDNVLNAEYVDNTNEKFVEQKVEENIEQSTPKVEQKTVDINAL